MSRKSKTKRSLTRRRENKAALRKVERELRAEIQAERDLVATLRTKLAKAEQRNNTERAEALADKIDRIRGKIAALRDRKEEIEAKLLKVGAVIKRLRRRLKRLRQKAQRNKFYASPHFRYDEFDCRDGTPVPKAAYPALRHMCKTYLEPLRAQYGTVYVNSGYRHASYNASIGGASNSIHVYDRHPDAVAVDHMLRGASPQEVADFHERRDPGGLGRYSNFTHIDSRQRLGWPRARWWG